jgi:hypothetical protein
MINAVITLWFIAAVALALVLYERFTRHKDERTERGHHP